MDVNLHPHMPSWYSLYFPFAAQQFCFWLSVKGAIGRLLEHAFHYLKGEESR
jgi:hypothetical protein